MAMRFNGTGESLSRTTNIPDETGCTLCGWAYRSVDTGTFATPFGLSRADNGYAILALDSDPEGEATALYLKEYLQDLPLRITRIASGIPVGAYVQYTDPITLSRAFSSRHELGS